MKGMRRRECLRHIWKSWPTRPPEWQQTEKRGKERDSSNESAAMLTAKHVCNVYTMLPIFGFAFDEKQEKCELPPDGHLYVR